MKNRLCFLALFLTIIIHAKLKKKPNVLLIMADDMGYSDLGAYGGEIKTPNLDKLARNGMKYSQFYNAARCCPTRASLMTGIYPHEAGIGHMTGMDQGGSYVGYLNDSCVTIATLMKQAGYATGISGKWHAGALKRSWPENRGFDQSYVIHHWVDSYFKVLPTCEIFENGKLLIPATSNPGEYDPTQDGKEWYTTDVFTTRAIQHIDNAQKTGNPFFEYLAYNAPHWPLEAHDDEIEKYVGKYSEGYETLRKSKYQKMIEMGLVSENWKLPKQDTPDWNSLPDSTKQDLDFMRAIYAAQITILDKNVGRLVNHLKSIGEFENTLILFLSDNGCSAEPMEEDFGWQWGKNTKRNYTKWRKYSARQGTSQGRVWAVASNTPFRKYKRFCHEGGISTPFIAHWPNGIVSKSSVNSTPRHIVDVMATCIEIAGVSYPQRKDIKPLRGKSMLADFKNQNDTKHEYIFWEHEGHGALRMGDWKIVSDTPEKPQTWELYNIKLDRTEMNNLAQKKVDTLTKMKEIWEKMAYETGA